MTTYDVYLEIGLGGECMAHVPSLPGCIARGQTREEAMAALPEAIRAYHAWLRRHGEQTSEVSKDFGSLVVAETVIGYVPFWRGSRAALFSPDREPVRREEMERYLQLASYARADLLALVRHLPEALLDWRASPDVMSVRDILRHVGNAEEWYVSRIVPPETLPPEWATDEAMPIFDFLEMERRTAVERLRRLTDRELAEVVYPAHWTNHLDEPWSARKALRRMVEHEREHIAHIEEVLAEAKERRWER